MEETYKSFIACIACMCGLMQSCYAENSPTLSTTNQEAIKQAITADICRQVFWENMAVKSELLPERAELTFDVVIIQDFFFSKMTSAVPKWGWWGYYNGRLDAGYGVITDTASAANMFVDSIRPRKRNITYTPYEAWKAFAEGKAVYKIKVPMSGSCRPVESAWSDSIEKDALIKRIVDSVLGDVKVNTTRIVNISPRVTIAKFNKGDREVYVVVDWPEEPSGVLFKVLLKQLEVGFKGGELTAVQTHDERPFPAYRIERPNDAYTRAHPLEASQTNSWIDGAVSFIRSNGVEVEVEFEPISKLPE